MNANDWEATNSNSVADLDTDESNPGSYDAVNRYGDENLSPILNNGIYGLNGIPDPKFNFDYPGLGGIIEQVIGRKILLITTLKILKQMLLFIIYLKIKQS